MKIKALRHSTAPIALAATLLTAVLVLFSPLSASAHDALVSSSPAADTSVETVPTELTLTFNAKVIDGEGAAEVVVTAPDGTSITDGAATIDGAVVTQPLLGAGSAGEYHVIWKVVSSDGHPTSGEYSFTVTVGDDAPATAEPTAAPRTVDPTTEQTAEPEATEATSAPATDSGDSNGATAWIWTLAIGGILLVVALIVALIVWYGVHARKNGHASDSDASLER